MMDFATMALQCGSGAPAEALYRIVSTESSFNPYAIGVVGGQLSRQPANKKEAIATAVYLERTGWNFSVGLAQINRYNLSKYGLDYESAFEPCANLRVAASVYNECFERAVKTVDIVTARLNAFSCYYSGNFSRGFMTDRNHNSSYVQRILRVNVGKTLISQSAAEAIPVVKVSEQGGDLQEKQKVHHVDDTRRLYTLNKYGSDERVKQLRGD